MNTEVEAKLGVDPSFEVPPLDDAVPGLVAEPVEPVSLEATYFDAADLRLVRAGISLRHRLGEGGPEGAWTLKLPGDDERGDHVLRRRELVVRGSVTELPAQLAVLVRPWLRTASCAPIAQLRTERRRLALRVDGDEVGEVDDDDVAVVRDGEVADRFREIEVETSDPAVLAALTDRLTGAGAGEPDPTPKLLHAVGPAAREPADLEVRKLPRGATAAEVLGAGMTAAVLRIVEHDAVIRAGVDPEGIHQARVGCRRLRSDLRTFGSLVDAEWADGLRSELQWLAGELGAVRDLDVLGMRLRSAVELLEGEDRAAADAVLTRLDRERERAMDGAIAALDSERYLVLLDRLVDGAKEPRTLPKAARPAADVVPPLAGAAFARLRREAGRVGERPTAEALHQLRIRAKRARYAADVAVPVVGGPARRFTTAMGTLQDVLGEFHDSVVAAAWLTDAAPTATRAQAFALGLLVAGQHHEADRLRSEWRRAWRAVDRPKLTAWMR